MAGGLCTLLGLAVLVGWYTHNLALIHVLPAFVGMAYNTALGFLLGGVSLTAAALGRPRVSLAAVVFALLVGVPTLAEYLFGHSFGLDQWLMPAYTRAGVTQMGRMAVATAISFVLLGLAFLRLNLPEGWLGRSAASGMLGALTAGLGGIALSGYFTGITAAYTWGQLTRMAVHTALGFILMGIGLTALAWSSETAAKQKASETQHWRAAVIGIWAATVSVCLWQALIVQGYAQAALMARMAARAGLGTGNLLQTDEILINGTLVAGLLLSVLLAGAVSLVQTARHQSSELGRARNELEERVQERTVQLADANESLAAANKALRDVLLAVTDGKFRLCEEAEQLPASFSPHRLPIPLDRQEIQTLRHFVRRVAHEAGLATERIMDLETAVGEAGMNAVVHGAQGSGEVYANDDGTVQVWVKDYGKGITLEHLPRATLERGYTTAGSLGHGFWLMLNTVDRLWLLTGTTGTTVVLEQDPVPSPSTWLRSVVGI